MVGALVRGAVVAPEDLAHERRTQPDREPCEVGGRIGDRRVGPVDDRGEAGAVLAHEQVLAFEIGVTQHPGRGAARLHGKRIGEEGIDGVAGHASGPGDRVLTDVDLRVQRHRMSRDPRGLHRLQRGGVQGGQRLGEFPGQGGSGPCLRLDDRALDRLSLSPTRTDVGDRQEREPVRGFGDAEDLRDELTEPVGDHRVRGDLDRELASVVLAPGELHHDVARRPRIELLAGEQQPWPGRRQIGEGLPDDGAHHGGGAGVGGKDHPPTVAGWREGRAAD